MTSPSVASRMAPEGAGRPKRLVKLFCFYYKTGSFLEPLANHCLKRLRMLYYEGRRLNGLWSPFGIETLEMGGLGSIELMAKWPVEPVQGVQLIHL